MQRARSLGLTHVVAVTTPDGLALTQALGGVGTQSLQQFVWFPRGTP